jgi:hypothetical protein
LLSPGYGLPGSRKREAIMLEERKFSSQHPALKATIYFAFTGLILASVAMFLKVDISAGFQAIFTAGIVAIGGFSSLNYWNKKKYRSKNGNE